MGRALGSNNAPRVVIVRDRQSAGGGIHNYYEAVSPYLKAEIRFCDVGRSHVFYSPPGRTAGLVGVRLVLDWLSLIRTIVTFRPDLVHLNPGLDALSLRSLRRDAVNVLTARMLGRPVLVFWRGWHNSWCGRPEFPGGSRGWLYRAYQLASGFVVLSARFRDDLVRWGFKQPIWVETTVASDDCLRPLENSPSSDAELNLLFLSRVEEAKGIFELLDIFRLVRDELPRCTLTIAGDGPDMEAVRRWVHEHRLEGVSFAGYVSAVERSRYYRRASLFCLLSYTEGMPNAVLEAMAMGLPVVASDAGGLSDILEDGLTGRVWRATREAPRMRFDTADIAQGIARLLRTPAALASMGAYNRRLAESRFSPQRVASRLQGVYGQVLE